MAKKVVLGFGTRPEAIKLAPVFQQLEAVDGVEPAILVTGQHQQQLDDALRVFGLEVSANLNVMTERQKLPELAQRILPEAARELRRLKADYVLVQGDTLSTFAIAWAAYLEGIRFGHVEAGLRSHSLKEPFPEEANRRLTSVIADLHLAPTVLAKENLLREGHSAKDIVVTGQTGVDAILFAAGRGEIPAGLPSGPYVTVTLHRRENWPILGHLAEALARVARDHPELTFVYPVHLNPVVREGIGSLLSGLANFAVIEPLEYGSMAALLAASKLIVTDSGGLQEEGTTLGIPVVVLRNVTERPEGVDVGALALAGTNSESVETTIRSALTDERGPKASALSRNPYGDGRGSERVALAVAWKLELGARPEDWV